MSRRSRSLIVVLLIGCVACGNSRAAPGSSSSAASSVSAAVRSDRATVVAIAAVQRARVDNSFGGQDTFATLAVVDGFAGPDDAAAGIRGDLVDPLADDERAAVVDALAPIQVRWISAYDPTQLRVATEMGARLDGILLLGAPQIAGDDATVASSLFCGSLCAIGGTHTLHRSSAGWRVTGTTGTGYIS